MPGPNRAPRGGYQKPKNMGKTISRLLGYLTRNPLPLFLVIGCLLVSVLTNLGGSYMMRGIINDFIWSGCTDFAGLGLAILKLIGIYVVGCLATYGQSATMVRLAQRGVNRLRKDLFDKLQDLPLAYFDNHPHGELMSRFTNDADNVQMALEQSVVSLLSSCLMFVGLVGLMLFINWKLFLVTLVVLAVTMLLFKYLGGKSRRFYREQQAALGAVNGNIQEMIEGLKVVKAFTHENQAKADFKELNDTYRDAAQKANFYSTMIMPVSGNLMNISYALTAAAGGLLSVLQGFDLGGLVVYLNYSKQVGQPLNQISQQMTSLLSAMAGAERIFEVMDADKETDEGKADFEVENVKGDIDFKHIDFSYVPEKQVLKDLDLEVKAGQKIAIVGATGSGKTTIVNLLTRFYPVDSGEITIDGQSIYDIPKDKLRRSIAIVLQDTVLFKDTIEENIRYGRENATLDEIKAAAKFANADEFIERLSEGYDTVLAEGGSNLSQGQRQLLSIARAVLADPKILILDEATSSVDTRTEMHIQSAMVALMKNRTSLIIAHRLSTIRDADKIVVIDGGRVAEQGSHEELIAAKGCYYRLYQTQFSGVKT